MGPQGQIVRLQIPGMERFHRLADAAVAQLAPRREQPVVDDGADPIVGEVEPLTHPAQHVAAHQLFDALRRRVLVETPARCQQRELELPPDHRRHRGELARALAQALQPAGDQLAHPLGQRQRPGIRGDAAFLEGAHGLDRDEGVALAGGPDLLLQARHRLRIGRRRGRAPG